MRRRRVVTAMAACGLAPWLGGCGRRRRPAEARRTIFYAALGASDVLGIGAIPLTNGYAFRIRDDLATRFATVDFVHLGYPGGKARDIRRITDIALRAGRAPDLVTLWTGANDLVAGDHPDDFEAELARILGSLREETEAVIVLGNLPDMRQLPRFRAEPSAAVTLARVEAFNRAVARQARAHDAAVVDLFGEPVEDELVSDVDGFHPSNDGHRRLAELFLAVIRPELGVPAA